MAQVVGKVSVLTTDAKGNYRLKIDEKWYGTGSTEDPGITQGQTVQFDFELSKPWRKPGTTTDVYFNNIVKGTLRPVTSPQSTPAESPKPVLQPGQARNFPGTGMSKDDFWANKEARDIAKEERYAVTQDQIQLQSARNAAIEFVKILASEKAIQYSNAANKQTPAARLDTIETLVGKYTIDFLNETKALGVAVVAEEQVEVGDTQAMAEQGDLG